MKRIKAFALLLGVVVLASCASQKRVIYLQDTQADEQVKIAQDYQIRIKPLDRLTVVVNSRDPELAAPFNTSTSLNSLTGTPLSTYSSNSASLQIRTVDENGDLDMPIIGPIQCKGKTRSELAQEIADKIREGGYISDPTVNIQFADMKISVIGEVARPGQYDITNDRISLLDALSLAGDLTIYGVRSDVKVIREENGVGVTVSELTCVRFYKFVQFYGVNNVTRVVQLTSFGSQMNTVYDQGSWWSEAGDAADVVTPRWLSKVSGYSNGTQYYYDGSYIRLKNAEIAYTFTDGWVRKLGVKNLKIYLNGNNLWVWSKMPDDRESNFAGSGNQGAYPTVKRFNLGVKFTL